MDRRGSLEENGHERARSTEYVEWGVHAGQRNPAALARGDGTGRAGARGRHRPRWRADGIAISANGCD